MTTQLPSFSIVIETANLGLAAIERLATSLDSIASQLPSPALAKEVVLLDDGGLPPELLQALCARHPWLSTRRIAPGVGYGDQKAISVYSVSADILILADCDCLYEPGWLASILETFAKHPEVQVVAGETTVAITGPFTLAMALVYFFPRFSYEASPTPARGFYCNNVAFRREVFSKCPFPDGLPVHRVQNAVYSQLLLEAGVPIWREPRACSFHAPPEDLWTALRRLFWTGRDSRKLEHLAAPPAAAPFQGDYEPYRREGGRVRKVVERVRDIYRQQPGMLLLLPLALPIASACVGAFFLGRLAERLQPSG
jgi:glycosyltransferase involved in cell wall biosynthesis